MNAENQVNPKDSLTFTSQLNDTAVEEIYVYQHNVHGSGFAKYFPIKSERKGDLTVDRGPISQCKRFL